MKANDSQFKDSPHGSLAFLASHCRAMDLQDIACWYKTPEKCKSCEPWPTKDDTTFGALNSIQEIKTQIRRKECR